METSLRRYLSAVSLHTVYQLFEKAQNPFVKTCMQQAYPVAAASSMTSHDDENKSLIEAQQKKLDDIDALIARLESTVDPGLGEAKGKRRQQQKELHLAQGISHWKDALEGKGLTIFQATKLKKGKAKKLGKQIGCPFLVDLIEAEKKRMQSKSAEQPEWIQQCHIGLESMEYHVREGKSWDTYCLVQIIQVHFEKVFVSRMSTSDRKEKDVFLTLLQAFQFRNLRAHLDDPSESEVLHAISTLLSILIACEVGARALGINFSAQIQQVRKVLRHAQNLIKQASSPGVSTYVHRMPYSSFRAMLLYCAEFDFESRLKAIVGDYNFHGRIELKNSAVQQRYQDLKQNNSIFSEEMPQDETVIVKARNALFHSQTESLDLREALLAMGVVLYRLDGISAGDIAPREDRKVPTDWKWSTHLDVSSSSTVPVTVKLQLSTFRMKIPVSRERCFVGRTDEVKQVVEELVSRPGARVLVHGWPGVGKDALAIEAVSDEQIRDAPFLQAWLSGTTDQGLRRQLIGVFEVNCEHVLVGCKSEEDKLSAIRTWLEGNSDWLFVVEDATDDCKALWECFPADKGRLLITSQRPLHQNADNALGISLPLDLRVLNIEDCFRIWIRMGVFSRKQRLAAKASVDSSAVVAKPIAQWTEDELKSRCDATMGQVSYPPVLPESAPNKEKKKRLHAVDRQLRQFEKDKVEADLKAQCDATCVDPEYKTLMVEYKPPTHNEGRSQTQARHKDLLSNLWACRELSNPDAKEFVEVDLGRLPLSVQLCGHLFRADDSITTLSSLISKFRSMTVAQVSKEGKNPILKPHYYGLFNSVMFSIDRMLATQAEDEATKSLGLQLMIAMSLLHGTLTPYSLFTSTEAKKNTEEINSNDPGDDGDAADHADPPLYSDPGFSSARNLLIQYGLLKASGDPAIVGTMHQRVQQSVRERYLPPLPVAPHTKDAKDMASSASVVASLRTELVRQFRYQELGDLHHIKQLRSLAPCIESFCSRLSERSGPGQVDMTRQDISLLSQQYFMCSHDGAHTRGHQLAKHILSLSHKMYPEDHPDIAMSMNNLANSYGALGDHKGAVKLKEETLALRRRILPEDHPDIAISMGNLANSYGDLGDHKGAVKLHKETLALRRRILPEDHPDIAISMHNLANSYISAANHADAFELLVEALRILRLVLPETHGNINKFKSALHRCLPHVASTTLVDTAAQVRAQGNAFYKEGKYEAAISQYDECLSYLGGPQASSAPLSTASVPALVNRAAAHFALKHFSQVVRDCTAATAIDAKNAKAHRLAGRALVQSGDYSAARRHLATAVALQPDKGTKKLLEKVTKKARAQEKRQAQAYANMFG